MKCVHQIHHLLAVVWMIFIKMYRDVFIRKSQVNIQNNCKILLLNVLKNLQKIDQMLNNY
jgi:hypothetical protein